MKPRRDIRPAANCAFNASSLFIAASILRQVQLCNSNGRRFVPIMIILALNTQPGSTIKTMKATGQIAATALLIVMGSMWGLQFAMLKIAAEAGHGELNVLLVTLLLLSIIFSGFMLVQRQSFRVNRERVRFLIITAMLGYLIPLLATLHAAPFVAAGILTLLACLTPVVAVLTALAAGSEHVSARRILAVIFGVVAVMLVIWPELELPDYGAAPWMLLALTVPLTYGIEPVYAASNWPRGWTSLQAVTGETIMAAVMVTPLWAIFGEPFSFEGTWTGAELAILVFVAAGVIESLIYFHLIRTTGGVFVNFGTFVSLFAGLAWGAVLFGERPGLAVWLAVTTLCIALALACMDQPSGSHGGEDN
jgi:drug/metabolite transporter (DMT)-like permease